MTTPPEPILVPPGSVEALGPPRTGVWEVETRGSRHIWDLDEMTYCRLPKPTSRAGGMPFDGTPMPITLVEAWPRIGVSFFVWYDDPEHPDLVEHYRISGAVRSIRPYEPPDHSGDAGEVTGDGG